MSSGRTHARAHSQEAYSWDSAQVCVNPKSVLLLFLLFSARIVYFQHLAATNLPPGKSDVGS